MAVFRRSRPFVHSAALVDLGSKPPLAAQSTKARSGPFAIIIQWGKDIVYINATSTRECTFALSFAR